VYRSPTPDLAAGSELWLADIDGGDVLSYEDVNVSGTPAGDSPRPLGSTGEWIDMPPLVTARQETGVAVARDPADPTIAYIYAVGGHGGGALGSYEYLDVTLEADGTQTAGSWTEGGLALPSPRGGLSALAVTHAECDLVAEPTTWIYAPGGAESTETDAAVVLAGGELDTWTAVDGMSPSHSGYGGLAGAGFLFAFGGQGGTPSDSVISAEIGPTAPDLINWNNEGDRLNHPRYLEGTTVESAFIYVVGGQTDTEAATATTERTVL
jgi:hypothetical protein